MRGPEDVTVWLKPAAAPWTAVGTELFRQVRPEHFKARATSKGADTCSFDLRRDPRVPQPDLAAWTPCEVEIAGVKVWKGQVRETPSSEGEDPVINVQGRGSPGHLDDDKYQAVYVHDRLADWKDARGSLQAPLTVYTSGWTVDTTGRISFAYPGPAPAAGGSPAAGILLDTAVTSGAARIAIDWARDGGAWAGSAAFAMAWGNYLHDLYNGAAAGYATICNLAAAGSSATFVSSGTLNARYLLIYAIADTVQDATKSIAITGARVFGSTSYESGGQSVLLTSQIISDAVTRSTELFSADRSQIAATTFTVPSFVLDGAKTPGEVCDSANALENRQLAVDLDDRVVYRALPSIAKWEIGPWAGAEFKDASLNSGDEIFDRVLVTGTAPDGSKVSVLRTTTIANAVTVQGFHRTQELAIRNTTTNAVAARIGDLWLQAHATTPLKGDVEIVGVGGIRGIVGGAPTHPAWLLRDGGELLRLSDRIDPDTGAFGRDGRIDAIDYDHDTLTASLSLDNDRRSVDALLERLAVVSGS